MKTVNNLVQRKNVLLFCIIAVLTIILILVSVISLKNGILDIFPYFYILPILILAYYSPRYAVYFTVLLGWIFLSLVYLYGPANIQLYAVSSAWFYIFVSIGVVISTLSGQLVQEKKYRQIFENSQSGIFTFNINDGKIQEINGQSAAILGFSTDELKTMLFSTLWFDESRENQFIKALETEKQVSDYEVELRRKDRTVIWVLVSASVTDEGLVVCSVLDITEQKRIKDDLIESELRYRTLFDGASDAIFIHDVDGKIFETNLIASKYLGYTKRELMQKHMKDLAAKPEQSFSKEMMHDLLARGHILFSSEQKRKDGTAIPVEISSRTTEYFGMPAVISIVRDISERKV
jgi:PAS domain S-box-containing protein